MRGWLIEQFLTNNTPVLIRDIKLDELGIASELFICNSVLGVIPVNGISADHLSRRSEINYQHHNHARLAQNWLHDKLEI
jgi:branched-subunit amino acid aminotransferase/4-amino-4-deoxychorismate lyase